MTIDDRLPGVIARTWPLLLDFDGPVTQLFIDGRSLRVADQMRDVLTDAGVQLPIAVQVTEDPLAILRWSATEAPEPVRDAVENASVRGEVAAVDECHPTPGINELLAACRRHGRPVVIVSNNAEEAIRAYLRRFQAEDQVQTVIARTFRHPELMKPHPDTIRRALHHLEAQPEQCALLGDSVTDVQVCHATGVASIGYAKNPRRGQELRDAGADAITDNLTDLARAVNEVTAPT